MRAFYCTEDTGMMERAPLPADDRGDTLDDEVE